jgi:hypothetical protein
MTTVGAYHKGASCDCRNVVVMCGEQLRNRAVYIIIFVVVTNWLTAVVIRMCHAQPFNSFSCININESPLGTSMFYIEKEHCFFCKMRISH